MLYILTGDVQIGKTRWLEQHIAELEREGVSCQGVIAPGVWRRGDDQQAVAEYVDANGFEKLGIDNVLLPQRERFSFARRRDIAISEGLFDPDAQAAKANLLWHIDECAIERVNEHLASLPHETDSASNLLVIDELGRLELLHDGGLTEALRLLDQGPTDAFPNALIIVREALHDKAVARFTPSWGTPEIIRPDEGDFNLSF